MLEASSSRAKEITGAIARMVILDCQPFSMVSDEGFKQLMDVGELRYQILGRATFADDIVPQLYETERKKVQDIINEDAKTVSITSPMFMTFITIFYVTLKNICNYIKDIHLYIF